MANNNAAFIWSIANLLRGTYKPAEYGDVILPFTILRRLDCVLEPTKDAVLAEYEKKKDGKTPLDVVLPFKSGHSFYNTSRYGMKKLQGDAANIKANLVDYIEGFSDNVRDIFDRFDFLRELDTLEENDLLFLVTQEFAGVDLHPSVVSNSDMGSMFEELIRKFAEASNETAGEHFTPRDAISLLVELLFTPDDDGLATPGIVRSLYDPTAGTGGMLAVAEEHIRKFNPDARIVLAGQEINAESYAICKSDLVIKGYDVDAITLGDTLVRDGHIGKTFDYCLSNPPYGVEWKRSEKAVRAEHKVRGYDGRFGPGLPSIGDGQLLFLMHLLSKLRPVEQGGGRAGIVLNGSALFTGAAGSGESEIRRYIIENDLLEAIVALPTDMFYNTGISTYVWILTNTKSSDRKGTVQLIDGSSFFRKMRKSLGSKRRELDTDDIETIVKLYGDYTDQEPDSDEHNPSELSKVFANDDFGYSSITVERPLRLNFAAIPERIETALAAKPVAKLAADQQASIRAALESLDDGQVYQDRDKFTDVLKAALKDAGIKVGAPVFKAVLMGLSERDETAPACVDKKGRPEPDSQLRDTERVPLTENIGDYFDREVLPHVPDAWIDHTRTKIGYEIPFTRHFYKYVPPRPLEEIDAELNTLVGEITALLNEVES